MSGIGGAGQRRILQPESERFVAPVEILKICVVRTELEFIRIFPIEGEVVFGSQASGIDDVGIDKANRVVLIIDVAYDVRAT